MNSLSELKEAIKRVNPLAVIQSFNGFELRTNIGFFELGPAGYYKDGKLLDNKELKEAMNGTPQAPPRKESKKRLPAVQAEQSKRLQAPRKTSRAKADSQLQRAEKSANRRRAEEVPRKLAVTIKPKKKRTS